MIIVTECPKPNLLLSSEYMIKLLESGRYELVETTNDLRALMLGNAKTFLWKNSGCSGNLEYISKFNPSLICCTLAANNYRLYDVENEPNLTSGQHLELYAGKRKWQPYLLSKCLPTAKDKKTPISKIDNVITKVRN